MERIFTIMVLLYYISGLSAEGRKIERFSFDGQSLDYKSDYYKNETGKIAEIKSNGLADIESLVKADTEAVKYARKVLRFSNAADSINVGLPALAGLGTGILGLILFTTNDICFAIAGGAAGGGSANSSRSSCQGSSELAWVGLILIPISIALFVNAFNSQVERNEKIRLANDNIDTAIEIYNQSNKQSFLEDRDNIKFGVRLGSLSF